MPQSSLARSPRAGSSAATKKFIPWLPRYLLTGAPAPPVPHMAEAEKESLKEEEVSKEKTQQKNKF